MHANRTTVSFIGLGNATAAPQLYAYVALHPQVFTVRNGIDYFANAAEFAKGILNYEAQFSLSPKEAALVRGDCSLTYLAHPEAAGLIARTYPNAKLFAVIDKPLTVLKVQYLESLRTGTVPKHTSFDAFIERHPEVLLRAKFGQQLAHYFSYYAANDLLVIVAEDVRRDPLSGIKQVYTHLGVAPNFIPESLAHLVVEEEEDPKKRGGPIRRLKKLIQKGIKRLRAYLRSLKPLRRTSTEQALAYVDRVVVTPAMLKKLTMYYASDLSTLSALLHRDMTVEWGSEDSREG